MGRTSHEYSTHMHSPQDPSADASTLPRGKPERSQAGSWHGKHGTWECKGVLEGPVLDMRGQTGTG